MTWHDLDSARTEWGDAPRTDERLQALLDAARFKVTGYASRRVRAALALPGAAVPSNLREAQLRVAINLWNDEDADTAAPDSDFLPAPRRYLEWHGLVRPRRGTPNVR